MTNESHLDQGLRYMREAQLALRDAAVFLDKAIEETKGATDTARLFVLLKEGREEYDAQSKRIGKLLNFLSNSRLPNVMESEDLRLIKFDQLKRRVQVSHRQGTTILPDKRDEAYTWFRSTGNEALITETVNASTLSAFGKDYLAEFAKDLPPELFKTTVQPFISVVKL